MSSVLVTEDDALLRTAVRASLNAHDYDVVEAGSGEEALTCVANGHPDLVILDLSLPGIDGIEALRHMRSFTDVPVLVLTVRDDVRDKVSALEAGADDYMTKPFEPDELIARVSAHLRRAEARAPAPPVVRTGDLEIDLVHSRVTLAGEPVPLTPTELRLLEVLLEHRGKLVTREQLLERVWGTKSRTAHTRVRVFVLHLRRKLGDDAARPRLIFTEPGLGYRWIGEHEESSLDDES